tara:strand:- start:2695 stop:2883 length:189 start_codon:yes stop_codon:yes gene_type:complete
LSYGKQAFTWLDIPTPFPTQLIPDPIAVDLDSASTIGSGISGGHLCTNPPLIPDPLNSCEEA